MPQPTWVQCASNCHHHLVAHWTHVGWGILEQLASTLTSLTTYFKMFKIVNQGDLYPFSIWLLVCPCVMLSFAELVLSQYTSVLHTPNFTEDAPLANCVNLAAQISQHYFRHSKSDEQQSRLQAAGHVLGGVLRNTSKKRTVLNCRQRSACSAPCKLVIPRTPSNNIWRPQFRSFTLGIVEKKVS